MGKRNILDAMRRLDRPTALSILACTVGLAGLLVAQSLEARCLQPLTTGIFNLPGEFRSLCNALAFGVLAVAFYFKLGSIDFRRATVGFAVAAGAGALLLFGGTSAGILPVYVAGVTCMAFANAWATMLLAFCLIGLPSFKAAAIATVGGNAVRQFALPLYAQPLEPVVGAGAIAVLYVAAMVLMLVSGRTTLRLASSQEALAELDLVNPLSSLWPPARLFVCALLVKLTYSFSCTMGVPGLSVRRLAVVAALVVLLSVLLIRKDRQEDLLFSLVVLFIIAGLILTPIVIGGDVFIAHTLMFMGWTCFSILLWLLSYGIGRRNVAAMAPVTALLNCLVMLGTILGDCLGTGALALAGSSPRTVQTASLALALMFFSFVWLCLKSFSFTDAIRGIEEAPQMTAEDEAALTRTPTDAFEKRCDAMARSAALTPREAEIFKLLARGRNARFVVENLGVTRNTAKAHIQHIYTKMGVHSHQELLSLVAGEPVDDDRG